MSQTSYEIALTHVGLSKHLAHKNWKFRRDSFRQAVDDFGFQILNLKRDQKLTLTKVVAGREKTIAKAWG